MLNPKLTWKPSVAADVDHYVVAWNLNGTALTPGSVPRNGSADALQSYSRLLLTDNPAVVLKDGDVVGVTVLAVDTTGLSSTPATPVPATVTVPSSPPEPPTNVILSLN